MSMRASTRIFSAIFIVFTCLALAFFWKVFVYYRGIKNGSITPSDVVYHKTSVSSAALASFAQGAPGSGALASVDDPALGEEDAKVTIVEFADFGCPWSQEEAPMLRALAVLYPHDLRIIYRDFPIDSLHPGATIAAKASQCAAEQGKFWEFHDALFKQQGNFDAQRMLDLARSFGLREQLFKTCMNGSFYDKEIATDQSDGVEAGVVGTPTFFVNGLKIEGDIPYETLKSLIDSILAQ